MTTWIDTPEGGRDRGPRALVRAWIEVLVRPRRFFGTAIAPADQAPALFFAMAVTATSIGGLFLAVPGLSPTVGGSSLVGGAVVGGLLVVLVTPVTLHLTAAVGTIALVVVAPDRGGVSETVQLVGYASAPLALVPVPVALADVSIASAMWTGIAYAGILLFVGIAARHGTGPVRTVLAALPPVVFAGGVVTAIRVGNAVVFGG
ncbi:putative membrane protein, Yip1 family [Halalkaliarchaeum sp. AArc-CO]|uniref:YIP1 family protein n=1 Tax=unclassified Halalkaliarchaeum TaxID=2678344 RepID=UPI00217DBBCB|nr:MULTISPECIES: YIP1 family protein [unclassified Halalkaliarchaeum]MDR5671941.1 YIP1 family protein [Halalkaliarchaeum sp. AArc-GB]UWG51446.1 putative membrane protein, Yip1 family [Halalkaliarchaeum sp. AArc-CO]